ncbi:MAG: SDR family oxidoreductase [Candidatus Competibacteraceae bacterium]|nr:SDR family oxidoreductase [Candidatus Competibacteraceae bacterium]
MILVTGATGTVGREVVRQLVKQKIPVRALSRSQEKARVFEGQDVEISIGDFDDPASLIDAMDGVERVLLVSAPHAHQWELQRNAIDAAHRARVAQVVKLSAMNADPASPTDLLRQHGEIEHYLARLGIAHTLLRPNLFMQTFLGYGPTIRDRDAFHAPLPDGRVSLVDARDVAEVAVLALAGSGHEGKTYTLTGPEALDFQTCAAILSEELGRSVRFAPVDRETARREMVESANMDPWLAGAVCQLFDDYQVGRGSQVNDDITRLTGHPPRSFRDFVRDHLGAFRA